MHNYGTQTHFIVTKTRKRCHVYTIRIFAIPTIDYPPNIYRTVFMFYFRDDECYLFSFLLHNTLLI